MRPDAPRRPTTETEIVFGFRAAIAVVERRPKDVRAFAATSDVARELPKSLLAALRANGVQVEQRGPREIERISETHQHEGIVLEAVARRWATPKELAELLVTRKGTCIALDRVRNSYNVGAILRSAAFFGIDAAILGAPAPHPALDPNAVRVAEGGAEHLVLARTTDLRSTLDQLRTRGVRLYGTDGRADVDVMEVGFDRPCVLVMGNEREGLAPRIREMLDRTVAIRGASAAPVESLNVGVAAGIFLARLAARA